MTHLKFLATCGGLWSVFALVACGGGGDGGPALSNKPLVVSGLAATGAAMANSVVSVKCGVGATVSGVTAADGSFNIVLRGDQALPCMVKVTRGDPEVTLYSLAATEGRVNVTPLTDLALAHALGSGGLGADPATAFPSFNATTGTALQALLPAAKTYVATQIQAVTGLTPALDLFSGRFQLGDADDKILDAFIQAMKLADLEIDSLRTLAAKAGDLKEALAVHDAEPEPKPEPEPEAPPKATPVDEPAEEKPVDK